MLSDGSAATTNPKPKLPFKNKKFINDETFERRKQGKFWFGKPDNWILHSWWFDKSEMDILNRVLNYS